MLVECHGTVEEEVEQCALNFEVHGGNPSAGWILGALKNSPGKWRAVPYTRSARKHSASSRQAVRIHSKTIGNSSIHLGPVRRALRKLSIACAFFRPDHLPGSGKQRCCWPKFPEVCLARSIIPR